MFGAGTANNFDDNEPLEGRGCGELITAFPAPCSGASGPYADLTWSQPLSHCN